MTPWLDDEDLAPEVRRLLEAGTPATRLGGNEFDRSKRRLSALTAIPATAGVFMLLQQLALGAALGMVTSVGVFVGGRVLTHPSATPAVHEARPAKSTKRLRSAAVPRVPAAPSAAPSSEPPPERELASRPPVSANVSASPAPDASTPFTSEAALLEQARRALVTDPSLTLAILSEHERRFPRGMLGVEREVLAVEALVRAGRWGDAEGRANRLRVRVPGSLYEERLRRILMPER
jgi:hypothetical protein